MQNAVRIPEIRKNDPNSTRAVWGKVISEEWRAMSDDAKAPYVARAQANSAQYRIDMENYSKLNTLSTPVALVTRNSCSAY